jgi:ectoine hydroxylase-related dioxygenase (phytanoyl-CoA dioxygenase family)
VFLKEPGFAETNWHSDLRMAPLDCNAFVTAWIPLRPVSGADGDSGLLFAEESHRDFALPFWHDMRGRDLEDRKYKLQDTGALSGHARCMTRQLVLHWHGSAARGVT